MFLRACSQQISGIGRGDFLVPARGCFGRGSQFSFCLQTWLLYLVQFLGVPGTVGPLQVTAGGGSGRSLLPQTVCAHVHVFVGRKPAFLFLLSSWVVLYILRGSVCSLIQVLASPRPFTFTVFINFYVALMVTVLAMVYDS